MHVGMICVVETYQNLSITPEWSCFLIRSHLKEYEKTLTYMSVFEDTIF